MACDACAWRSQWIDPAGLTPARPTASLTMKLTARAVSGLPGRRTDWNTGADAGASPRLAYRRAAITLEVSTRGSYCPCLRSKAGLRRLGFAEAKATPLQSPDLAVCRDGNTE